MTEPLRRVLVPRRAMCETSGMTQEKSKRRGLLFSALAAFSGLALLLAIWTLKPAVPGGERPEPPPPPEAKDFSGRTGNSSQSVPSGPTAADVRSLPVTAGLQPQLGRPGRETVAGSAQNEDQPPEQPAPAGPRGAADPSSQAGPVVATDAAGTAPGSLELVIPVPRGARVPAIFYDETPRPAPQQRMLDRIAREFNDAVNQAGVAGGNAASEADLAEIWRAAAERADQQYINLYGFSAWHELHLRGAKEALRERKAVAPR